MTYQVIYCHHILLFIYFFSESQRKGIIFCGFIPNFSRHFSSSTLDNGLFYGQIRLSGNKLCPLTTYILV